jgi:hypothetical protein
MVKLAVQIGFRNNQREFQKVQAFLNNAKVNWEKRFDGSYNGEFLTPVSKRGTETWFLAQIECDEGDSIRMEIDVFLKGRGPDEDRTRIVEFQVSDLFESTNYEVDKVGTRDFPLFTGKAQIRLERRKIEDRRDRAESIIQETESD